MVRVTQSVVRKGEARGGNGEAVADSLAESLACRRLSYRTQEGNSLLATASESAVAHTKMLGDSNRSGRRELDRMLTQLFGRSLCESEGNAEAVTGEEEYYFSTSTRRFLCLLWFGKALWTMSDQNSLLIVVPNQASSHQPNSGPRHYRRQSRHPILSNLPPVVFPAIYSTPALLPILPRPLRLSKT